MLSMWPFSKMHSHVMTNSKTHTRAHMHAHTHTHIIGLETIFSTPVGYPNMLSPWQPNIVPYSQDDWIGDEGADDKSTASLINYICADALSGYACLS